MKPKPLVIMLLALCPLVCLAAPAKRGISSSRTKDAGISECAVRLDGEMPSQRKVIVLLAAFPDLPFTYSREDFESLLCRSGYSVGGAEGCAEEYFDAQFGGRCHISFTVAPPVTLTHDFAYYGADDAFGKDIRPAHAVKEACILSDEAVDFSEYTDVVVFYAGGSAADGCSDDRHIWPHNWTLTEADLSLTLDGVEIDRYAMCPELMKGPDDVEIFTGIGLLCHEYLHTLGLMDMYDTDGAGSGGVGDALGGSTSVMDQGMYNCFGCVPPNLNAMELEMLSLVEPLPLSVGSRTMLPFQTGHDCFRLDTSVEGEYFLFECRSDTGWDKGIGRRGLFVYHIDRSDNDAGGCPAYSRWESSSNSVNACRQHQCALLLTPEGTFTPSSEPAFVSWGGTPAPLSLVNISRRDDGAVSFTVPELLGVDAADVFQDAVILQWSTTSEALALETSYLVVDSGTAPADTIGCAPYEPGRYSCRVEHLIPGRTYGFRIYYEMEGTGSASAEITTVHTGGYPFIALPEKGRMPSGALQAGTGLPLRLFNAVDAVEVRWYWNGREICAGGDGYYRVWTSGELKAVAEYAGGPTEIFIKRIVVQ